MSDINVYTGPMKCGKTQKILDQAQRLEIAGKNIAVFKPVIDDRFGEGQIVSRNGSKIKSIDIKDISEIENYDVDVYLIDEFQFLGGEIESIQKLSEAR